MTALSVADDQLRAFFERWNRLEEEKTAISEDLKALFAEAKGVGFDTKAMRVVFRERTADDSAKLKADELDQICDLYRASLSRARPANAPARTRENIEKFASKEAHAVGVAQAEAAGQGSAPVQVSNPAPVTNSPSSEPISSPATAKADDAPHPLAASSADPFEPPAFLRKATAADYRPHCQNPERCASYKLEHCRACAMAADLLEDAA